jgi:hypothetical protein
MTPRLSQQDFKRFATPCSGNMDIRKARPAFLFCAIAHAKTWPNQPHRHHADINFQGISMG